MAIVHMLLNGLGIYHLSRKPVPAFVNPLSKEMLPNATFEPLPILLDFGCLGFLLNEGYHYA